jgi:hypothetical protein
MSETMRALASPLAFAAIVGSTVSASGEPACAKNGRPFVTVRLAPSVPAHPQVLAQLRAGLANRGIGVCSTTEAPARAPVATIELQPSVGERVSIVVAVADRVTDKRVSREIDLEPLPRDAWPLSLALAADEVLRASWAELALSSAPAPRAPVPEEVKTTVRDSLRDDATRPDAPQGAIGAAFVADLYGGGQRQLGVDARGSIWLSSRVFVLVGVGLRSADAVEAQHGTVRSSAFVGLLGPGLSLTDPRATFGLEAHVRGELVLVRYRAEPDAGSEGRERSAIAVYGKAGVSGFFAPERGLRLTFEVLGGAPIRAVTAEDTGSNATGISGLGLSAALGLSGVL